MNPKESNPVNMYRIRVEGILFRPITETFSDIIITPKDGGETVFIGQFVDQPALRGFLDQLWNLNFTILSLERVEDKREKGVCDEQPDFSRTERGVPPTGT